MCRYTAENHNILAMSSNQSTKDSAKFDRSGLSHNHAYPRYSAGHAKGIGEENVRVAFKVCLGSMMSSSRGYRVLCPAGSNWTCDRDPEAGGEWVGYDRY